jgi:1-acyl-sn-glycerol-3-phosphate acyltransferase
LSEFDMFPMQFAMQRLIFFMGKAELFRNPVLAAAYRQLGGFPVERGARDPWAYQHALRVLEHGQVLGLFPEGTRSRKHGLLPAKTGAARLAIEARCPVVLVAVEGTQRMFKRSLRRTPVNITMSEPYYPVQGVSALEFMDHLMFTLADMLPAELRGVYAERPKGFRV